MLVKTLWPLLFLVACTQFNPKEKTCNLGQQSCAKGELCLQVDQGSYCNILPNESPEVQYPFASGYPTKCQKGFYQEGQRTIYDYNAVQLASLPGTPAGKVYAVDEGIAYVYDDCTYRENNSDAHTQSTCGQGLGNHIRIMHPNGLMTVYGHLSEVFIKDTEKVHRGQEIGTEGASGLTDQRALHFSVHRPWDAKVLQSYPGATGPSIPFQMRLGTSQNNQIQTISSTQIPCGKVSDPLIFGVWQ